jgi:2-iminobutanoate/2-iminopropanoate deaminase
VFVSGQVPRDPVTGELVGDAVEAQTRQVIANVERALKAAGASLSDVVSIIAYLADIDDWGRFNAVYREVMPQPYPTRTALGANLRGILVEVSAVAFVGTRA